MLGSVVDVKFNDVSDALNRRVHTVTMITNERFGTTTTFNINVRNAPEIYVFNQNAKTVRMGSVDDIPSWNGSSSKTLLFAHVALIGSEMRVKGIVLAKDYM